MLGAELTAGWLAAAGVRTVFSLSGNQILPLYEALDRAGIRIIHTRHEASAVHMADAYARLTGQVGVCLVTAGPGHANALGALAMAESGESPVVLLSGHSPIARAGQGAFQEMDQVALARPLTRWSGVAAHPGDIPSLLTAAFEAARSGRNGPAHLSLPVDVLTLAVPAAADSESPALARAYAASHSRLPTNLTAPHASISDGIESLLRVLHDARRPLILAGPSAARPGLHSTLSTLASRTGVPLLILDHPRGLTDPALGHAGQALPEADAILLFGKRQDYRIGYGAPPTVGRECRLLQVDPDESEIGRNRSVEVGIVEDLPAAAQALNDGANRLTWPVGSVWWHKVESLRSASLFQAAPAPDDGPLHPLHVFDALAQFLDSQDTSSVCAVLDGGEFGQWARARLRLRPPGHLLNEPSGAIGFALPFALGARVAQPHKTVVAVAGDGAFGFTAMELETAVRCGLPVLVIVGTDAAWGTERHLQIARYGAGRAVATELMPARYDLLAAGMGCHGEYVERFDQLAPALHRAVQAVDSSVPALLNVRIQSVTSPAGQPPG